MLIRLGAVAILVTFCISTATQLAALVTLLLPLGTPRSLRYAMLCYATLCDAVRDAAIGFTVLAIAVGVALARPRAAGVTALLIASAAEAFFLSPTPAFSGLLARVVRIPYEDGLGGFLVMLACSAVLNLALVMPARHPLLRPLDRLVPDSLRRYVNPLFIVYLLPLAAYRVVLSVSTIQPDGYDPYYVLAYGLWGLILISALLAFGWSYWRPPTRLARAQLKWLLVGLAPLTAFALIQAGWGAITGTVFALPRGPWVTPIVTLVPPLVAIAFPLTVGFSILRYRLFDVDRLLRLTITWMLLAAGLLASFVSLAFIASRSVVAIGGPEAAADPTSSVVAALLVASVAYPLHQRLVRILDRLVFRERAARLQLLEAAADVLGRAQTPEVVAAFLTQRAPRLLGIQLAQIALSPVLAAMTDDLPDGLPPRFMRTSAAVLERLGDVALPLLLEPTSELGGYSARNMDVAPAEDPALAALYAQGARLLVPLRADVRDRNDLVGVWVLGGRGDADLFEPDDLAVLDRIARLAALLLVARGVGRERERLRRELSVAKVVQQTLLPPPPPLSLVGWQVRTHYRAAPQVGGDFYDFIALPEGRLGVAIGSVSGTGIPAALIMATSQSILHASAVSGEGPGIVLERVNALLRDRLPEHMFVTCHYAVLEPGTGCVRIASAGHSLPQRAAADVATEPASASQPLGVAADARYTDQVVPLARGERLVMCGGGPIERDSGALAQFAESDAVPTDDMTRVVLERV